MSDLSQQKLFDPKTLSDPYAFYRKLHQEAPVWHDKATNIYVVTGYDAVRQVAMQPQVFSSRVREWLREVNPTVRRVDEVYAKNGYARVETLSLSDPPKHTRYRNMVRQWFTPEKMTDAEPHVLSIVDELLDGFVARGACDFHLDFSVPMPIRVFAVQLGVVREEMGLFQKFGDAGIEAISMVATPDREVELAYVGVEEQKYFAAQIEKYRKTPDRLLISDLANARDESGALYAMEELVSIIAILVLGGNETTTNALSTAMWLMCENPGLEAELRADRSLLENFIEEALRYQSPVHGVFRICTKDTALAGVDIPANSRVLINFGAANRDEKLFAQSDRFDPRREEARRHLAFGQGIKHCIGAPLARLELRIAFDRILERMCDIRPETEGFVPRFAPHLVTHGMLSLPIVFRER